MGEHQDAADRRVTRSQARMVDAHVLRAYLLSLVEINEQDGRPVPLAQPLMDCESVRERLPTLVNGIQYGQIA